jgi:hypothetical protein
MHCKLQTRPLIREDVPTETRPQISDSNIPTGMVESPTRVLDTKTYYQTISRKETSPYLTSPNEYHFSKNCQFSCNILFLYTATTFSKSIKIVVTSEQLCFRIYSAFPAVEKKKPL